MTAKEAMEVKGAPENTDPEIGNELDQAADGLVDLLARALAERHVAAYFAPEKEKNANP